jgi:fused signal recognition particle receptor
LSAVKWFSKVKSGLSKTTMGITKSIFGAKFDANTIEQLEEQLIKADMGLGVAEEIVQQVK